MPIPAYIIGLVVILQALGCTASGTNSATVPAEPAPISVPPASTTAIKPRIEPTIEPRIEPQTEPLPADVVRNPPAPESPIKVIAPPETPTPPDILVKPAPPAARPPAKISPTARAEQSQKPLATEQARSEPQGLPPLALATLEQRLKDTNAIGVFTKLALKNQVDDLLSQIRAQHEGRGKSTLGQLRQLYDQLLRKAHDLLKKDDPPLASAIMDSRESIWVVLTDPVRFAKL